MYRFSLKIEVEITPLTFWSILPAFNINISSKEIEFEWLCIGIYTGILKDYIK